MAVDDRYKRGSATAICMPWQTPLAQPNTNGVDQLERQAVTWTYSGILASAPVVITWTNCDISFLYTAANWSGVSFYLEAMMKATSGTVYARLHDGTDPVTDSEMNSVSATFERKRTAALTLTNGSSYVAQIGCVAGDTGAIIPKIVAI